MGEVVPPLTVAVKVMALLVPQTAIGVCVTLTTGNRYTGMLTAVRVDSQPVRLFTAVTYHVVVAVGMVSPVITVTPAADCPASTVPDEVVYTL
jgi:hypothetical protein